MALSSIVEKVMAYEIRKYEVVALEEEVVDYLNKRQELFLKYERLMTKPKPKHHYVSHYAEATLLYGPTRSCWTARFESKHRVAKGIGQSAKNFINISKTVAQQQQYRAASVFFNGVFKTEDIEVNGKVRRRKDLEKSKETAENLALLDYTDEDSLVVDEVLYRYQMYRTNEVVILQLIDRNSLKIGLIQSILVKGNMVFFLIYKYIASRHKLGYYVTGEWDQTLYFVSVNTLLDFKPLPMHGQCQKFKFALHHFLSQKCSDQEVTVSSDCIPGTTGPLNDIPNPEHDTSSH